MSNIKTLVFPCGSEAAMEIAQALGRSVHVELYGASSRDDHGRHVFPRYAHVPNIADANFDERFGELLHLWGVQLLFATHDTVLDYLAARVAQWGVHLVNGDPRSARITRHKSATYALFEGESWVPRCFANLDQVEQWPILLKPDCGQGGQGVSLAHSRAQAEIALGQIQAPVICEYLPGEELTVDCFTDWRQHLIYIGPRSRERVVGGITMHARLQTCGEDIRRMARCINQRLAMRGPWFFQLKRDQEGQWKLLEVSCRLSTSSVIQRAAGVNLPLMAVHDFMQRELQVERQPYITLVERRLASIAELKYDFETAYFDYDDTILCDGVANPQAMRFIYRLVEMGKRLVLVTRHAGDLRASLASAHIAESLFDEISHLRCGEPKSSCIQGAAIFIDNHFPERLEVARVCGIPVFDVDAMELLFP